MGFWKTFFSAQKCENCGSYNTDSIYFEDLTRAEQNNYWKVAGDVSPKYVYRCEDCGKLTILCADGRIYWTSPRE